MTVITNKGKVLIYLMSKRSVMNDNEVAVVSLCPIHSLHRALSIARTLAAVLLTQMDTTHTCMRNFTQTPRETRRHPESTGSAVAFLYENKTGLAEEVNDPNGLHTPQREFRARKSFARIHISFTAINT